MPCLFSSPYILYCVLPHPFLHSNVSSSYSAVHLFFLSAPVHHALHQEVLPGWPPTPGSWAAYKQLILSASCLAWTGAAPILVCLQMGLLQEAMRVFGCVFVCLCVRVCNVCVWVFMLFDSERRCVVLLLSHSSQKEAEEACFQKCIFPWTVIAPCFSLVENGLAVSHMITNVCPEIAWMLIFLYPVFSKQALA